MAIRIFACHACGHGMRMADRVCHACFSVKRTYQLPLVFWSAATGVVVALDAMLVAVF